MTHGFDEGYWEHHWRRANAHEASSASASPPPNPYLVRESSLLAPGTALDAGCGAGAEAMFLASRGWQVTAVDISPAALRRAVEGRSAAEARGDVRWVPADLTTWQPDGTFDLVATHYAHPAMPQLAFYDRISRWVTPGGSLLIVGHMQASDGPRRSQGEREPPPGHASVRLADVVGILDDSRWEIVMGDEVPREVQRDGRRGLLQDVVVRAVRRA